MEIVTNEQGYVSSYNLTTDTASIGGHIVDTPEDLQDFEIHFYCYKLVDGALQKDSEKLEWYRILNLQTEIRARREKECFNIIDRSKLWYDKLTNEQYQELSAWYEAWLNAPETLIVPTAPNWL